MHCECCHYVDLKKITFCRELTCINKKLLCRWRIIQYRMKCFLFLFQPWLVKIALHYYLPIQFSWTQTNTSYLNPRLVIFKKKTTSGRRVLSKNGILWATVGSSSAIVFAEFDLFFSSADHVVSVGPGNNFFLRRWSISSVEAVVEESVDQPSIIAQPSKDNFFFCLSSVGRSTLRHLGFRQAETDSRPKIDQGSLVCRTIFIYRLTDQWLHK